MPSKNKSLAKKNADKWFSIYIRLRDADHNGMCRCCTSGEVFHWKEIHCGHFISRRFLSTRFDEKNCAAQSVYSNTYLQGEQYEFGKYIDKRWGEGTADQLAGKSRQLVKYTKQDYEGMVKEYRELARQIADEKGIEI